MVTADDMLSHEARVVTKKFAARDETGAIDAARHLYPDYTVLRAGLEPLP